MRSAQPVSLVELFSVPGAGKSTLVDAVSRERPLMTREAVSASWQKLPRTSKLAHVVGAFLDPRVSWAAIATAFAFVGALIIAGAGSSPVGQIMAVLVGFLLLGAGAVLALGMAAPRLWCKNKDEYS